MSRLIKKMVKNITLIVLAYQLIMSSGIGQSIHSFISTIKSYELTEETKNVLKNGVELITKAYGIDIELTEKTETVDSDS